MRAVEIHLSVGLVVAAALLVPAGVARGQAKAALSADELFITKHPWIFRGGGAFSRYGATSESDKSGTCLEKVLQFRPDHTVLMRCDDNKDLSGTWKLEITTQTTLVVTRADLKSELRFDAFFHGGDPERLNLQEPNSERMAKKTVWSYGTE